MTKNVILTISLSLLLLGTTACFVGCGSNTESVPVATTVVVSPTSEVSCPNCKGIGRYDTCPRCADMDSSGRRACVPCSGTGTILCGFCNGRGVVPQAAVPRIETQMEVQRIGIEAEQRERERREQEQCEQEMRAMELAAQVRQAEVEAATRAAEARAAADRERIAAAERERERAEQRQQEQLAAQQRERERIAEEQRQREAWEMRDFLDHPV